VRVKRVVVDLRGIPFSAQSMDSVPTKHAVENALTDQAVNDGGDVDHLPIADVRLRGLQ